MCLRLIFLKLNDLEKVENETKSQAGIEENILRNFRQTKGLKEYFA